MQTRLLGVAVTCAAMALGAVVTNARQPSPLPATQVCQAALWKKAFDEATAAGLNPGAIAVTYDPSKAKQRDEGPDIVVTGVEAYRPTPDVAAFPVRYECRVDRATRTSREVTYVAVDANGDDIARPPTDLVKAGRLLNACVDRLESGLDEDARKRGAESPRAEVEIAPTDAEIVGKGNILDIQGRGRARYGDGFNWQILVFTCRYDQKKQRVTRETHGLETPSPIDALPARSRDAVDACRAAVGEQVLADALQRGYRQLHRVEVELKELADVKTRDRHLDVSGRGQFKLDDRHRQPTPLTFTCVYDPAAARVVSARFQVEAGSWTPSGQIANGPTGSLRCGARNLPRQECAASIRGNVRIVREFGSARCEAYRNWMWSNSQIVVWDGCAAEFEYDAR